MDRAQLESWLCGPDAPVPTPEEIVTLLGLSIEDVGDTTLLRTAARLRALRFVLAVLRDVFADDLSVRFWLRTPRPRLGGLCALDLLLAGRLDAVEEMAVREWHEGSAGARPGQATLLLAHG